MSCLEESYVVSIDAFKNSLAYVHTAIAGQRMIEAIDKSSFH